MGRTKLPLINLGDKWEGDASICVLRAFHSDLRCDRSKGTQCLPNG
jgi:hypothetical protein